MCRLVYKLSMLSMWCGMKKKTAFEWLQGPLFMQVNDLDMQKQSQVVMMGDPLLSSAFYVLLSKTAKELPKTEQ